MPLGHNESVDGITSTISGLRVEEKGKYVPPHLRNRAPEPTNWADQAEDVDPRDQQRGGGGAGWDRSGSWGMDRAPRGGGGDRGSGGDRGGGGDRGWSGDRGDSRGVRDDRGPPPRGDFGGGGGYRDGGRDSRGPPPSFGRGGGRGGGFGGGGLDRWTSWHDTRHDPEARAEQARAQKPDTSDPSVQAVFGQQSNSGLDFSAYDDIPVETSGRECPAALVTFDDVDLGDVIMNNIVLAKYSHPTPVQKASIPIALKGMFILIQGIARSLHLAI